MNIRGRACAPPAASRRAGPRRERARAFQSALAAHGSRWKQGGEEVL